MGTLVVGLVFGRLGRVGPVITSMSHGAAQSLSALGMVTFLAYAGVRAGGTVPRPSARTRAGGWPCWAWCSRRRARRCSSSGVHVVRRMPWLETAGAIGGAQTQPAIAYVNERTGHDTRVGVAYALVYPVAMITKIVIAQVLAGLG